MFSVLQLAKGPGQLVLEIAMFDGKSTHSRDENFSYFSLIFYHGLIFSCSSSIELPSCFAQERLKVLYFDLR